MGERFTVVGWNWGTFQTQDGRMQPYANLYVYSPVSASQSENFHAVGYKAEKLKCTSPSVWIDAGLEVGCDANLVFGRNNVVTYAEKVAEGSNSVE